MTDKELRRVKRLTVNAIVYYLRRHERSLQNSYSKSSAANDYTLLNDYKMGLMKENNIK